MSKSHDEPGTPDEGLTPEEAFTLVGNDVRAEMLRALSRARGGQGQLRALPFSELRSRIDMDIDSGQFNYHLQQLLGTFIEEGENRSAQLDARMAGDVGEGYVLRPEGTILTRTIRALASIHQSLEPFDVGFECHYCGTNVEGTYGNTLFMAQCPGCEYMYEYELTPPGSIDADEELMLEQIEKYIRHRRLTFADGVCPLCSNSLQTAFLNAEETVYPRSDRREVVINRWCDHCGERDYLRTGELLLREPALMGFCDDHSIDIRESRLWELEFVATGRYVTVRSTDPWEIAFRFTSGTDSFHVVIDEELSITQQ